MSKDEALKMAIGVMENSIVRCKDLHHAKKDQHKDSGQCPVEQRWNATIQACKEALEQPTQEPVGEINTNGMAWFYSKELSPKYGTILYTHPKEWQSLSDDDINGAVKFLNVRIEYPIMFARLIEMHLKEKNT